MAVTVNARGINDAFYEGAHQFLRYAKPCDSRNGPMRRVRGVFITTYSKPEERVLLDPDRDCNPFFHLMEAVWMLAGRQDVEFPTRFNKSFGQFSDDGIVFHGAYGFRWRYLFNMDQITHVIRTLKKDNEDRRAVIQMYDQDVDQPKVEYGGKDIPCNLMISFHVWNDKLDMSVFNRSNDMIWGAYGSNVVHFSMLQELVAAGVGVSVGEYAQVSSNTHVYERHYELVQKAADKASQPVQAYDQTLLYTGQPIPLVHYSESAAEFLNDCEHFCHSPELTANPTTIFFKRVILPMFNAWQAHRVENDSVHALKLLNDSDRSIDWIEAGCQWLERRLEAKQ